MVRAGEVIIPNKEVLQVFKSLTKPRDWAAAFRALADSQKLLEPAGACDEATDEVRNNKSLYKHNSFRIERG